MIDPVLAYYQIRFLSKIYWGNDAEDPSDILLYDCIGEIADKFKGRKFDTFYIYQVYSDGECKIIFHDLKRFSKIIRLKDVWVTK